MGVQEMEIGARRDSLAKGSANDRESVNVRWRGVGMKPYAP